MNGYFNVVKAELFKSVRKKRTYILAGLLWVLLPILVLIVGRIIQVNFGTDFVDNTSPIGVNEILQTVASPFGIARVVLLLPALVSPPFYIIVISLLAALFIGEERSQNMWKTTLVAQPNRFSVLAGKFTVAMIVFGIMLLGSYLLSFVYGGVGMLFLPTTFAGEWLSLLGLYGLQWLYSISAMLFAFLMIWLLRNVSLGIVSIFFLPALLEGLYSVYAATVGFQPLNRLNVLFQTLRLRNTLEDLPRYFFTSNLYAPAREPLNSVVATLFPDDIGGDFGPLNDILGGNITLERAAIVMGVYALIFGSILVVTFVRRDVS